MAIKNSLAPMGTHRGTLRRVSKSDRVIITLPCCVSVKTHKPTSKTFPALLFYSGQTFTCHACRQEFEIAYYSGDQYTIQWTQRQD
jgi:hypothetical protein